MHVKVTVGSTNPVKIAAVQEAFEIVWPECHWEVIGIPVSSGVSDQPMSDLESIAGARNRASEALAQGDAAYGVGLEGGLQQIGDRWFDCGWIVVVDTNGHEGMGATLKMAVPDRMMEMIQQGLELGEVVDRVFHQHNGKQASGHFGLMTRNAIVRKKAFADGIIAALACFIHVDLFFETR